jgi:hypothetical protein
MAEDIGLKQEKRDERIIIKILCNEISSGIGRSLGCLLPKDSEIK